MIKEGEKVKVDPRLTGLDEWIEGTVSVQRLSYSDS